jgi:hypothetical protein
MFNACKWCKRHIWAYQPTEEIDGHVFHQQGCADAFREFQKLKELEDVVRLCWWCHREIRPDDITAKISQRIFHRYCSVAYQEYHQEQEEKQHKPKPE